MKSIVTSNEKVIAQFVIPSSTMASNKQRREHNKLATTWRAKIKGAHESNEPLVCET